MFNRLLQPEAALRLNPIQHLQEVAPEAVIQAVVDLLRVAAVAVAAAVAAVDQVAGINRWRVS